MVSTGSVSDTLTHAGGAHAALTHVGKLVTADIALTEEDMQDVHRAIEDLILGAPVEDEPQYDIVDDITVGAAVLA